MQPCRFLDVGKLTKPPAVFGNKTIESSYARDTANVDINMVIVLVALLCALIGALGVKSIGRCALCCRRRFSTEMPEQVAARLATTGLKKRDLCKIPVAFYGSHGVNINSECPICLGEFEDGDQVRVLPKCNHGFHMRCIDTWFVSHSCCPNCRHSLLERKASSGSHANPETHAEQPISGRGSSPTQAASFVIVIEGSAGN